MKMSIDGTDASSGQRTIEELMQTVSASRLLTWQQCRLKFFFRYVAVLQKPKPPALVVGSSVHEVLKFWNRSRWWQRSPSDEELQAAFQEAWAKQKEAGTVQWEEGEDEHIATAWRLLESYFRETPIPADEKPEAVEVSVEADLTAHGLPILVGIIDLVRPAGRIVDYKTAAKTPNGDQVAHYNETQLTVYSLLYRNATGNRESGLELHHLIKTKQAKLVITKLPPTNDGQISRLFQIMDSYISGLEREDWIPSPGMQCASCEFFYECRGWRGK